MDRKFTIIDEITREYRRFNTVGTQRTVRQLPPPVGDERDPVSHFIASVTILCEHALQNCADSDMVDVSFRNEVNMRDNAIGISFRCIDQLSTDVFLNVWQKVTQFNSRLNAWTNWFLRCIA